jgi:hypothetical protein
VVVSGKVSSMPIFSLHAKISDESPLDRPKPESSTAVVRVARQWLAGHQIVFQATTNTFLP